MNIISKPSPNFFKGRDGYHPIAIVVHIMEGTLDGTDSWFKDPASKVSAHYGVGRNGEVHQYVQETDSAWHAGRVDHPSWKLINTGSNPNHYTIGIEHEGQDNSDWTDQTYASSSALIRAISDRWHIPLDRDHILGHHEIYSLKTCPGEKVDLNKLISMASGLSTTGLSTTGLSTTGLSTTGLSTSGSSTSGLTGQPVSILQLGSAISNARLNIRRSPNRNAPPVTTIPSGTAISYDGFTENGESISGNAKWYYTPAGTWFWSGGVN